MTQKILRASLCSLPALKKQEYAKTEPLVNESRNVKNMEPDLVVRKTKKGKEKESAVIDSNDDEKGSCHVETDGRFHGQQAESFSKIRKGDAHVG